MREGFVEVASPECDVYERVYTNNEDNEFDGAGEMVVDEASSVDLGLSGEHVAIYPSEKPFLDDVLFDEEEDDKDDGNDKAGVWREERQGGKRGVADMLVAMYIDVNHPVTLLTIQILASCVRISKRVEEEWE